ncbi:hypothetical protein DKM44_13280 [Deinococcus irradiatisoli]|uniref:Uncharacterized protein n=1 Tax=Deinococcus irradiatisoli TaxID=2202254 RepID=A0A2Z3JU38_9DEIO|nr:hypothetical protein DKM44_13280 [Deinococcus irradiatisoli]
MLTGAALAACPAHPGQILDGKAAQPAGLQAICGDVYEKFNRSFSTSPNVKWVELYAIKKNADTKELGQTINETFSKLGYSLVKNTTAAAGKKTFAYFNTATKKNVVMYMTIAGPVVLMSFAGN